MTFRNVLLPPCFDLDWQSSATFNTDIVQTDNGRELRNINWAGTLAKAVIRYNARNARVWPQLDEFFQIVQGRGYSFKVRDPRKWIAESGEGVFVAGQAMLRITRGSYTLDKTINKIEQTASTISGGTVNYSTGISGDGATSWVGEFYLCMRLDTDSMEAAGINKNADGLIAGFPDVPLVEVLDE